MPNLLILAGDGIGPEVMAEVKKVIGWFNGNGMDFAVEEDLVGGCAYDAHGQAVSDATMDKALQADAVLLGAVGGPKWDKVPYEVRPEAGLLRLRKDLELFANLRPAKCFDALADFSSLKRELVEGLDILIVRELTGGVYFGEPKEIRDLGQGQRRAIDTQVYDTYEIERIASPASATTASAPWRSGTSCAPASSGTRSSPRSTRTASATCSFPTCWPMPAACSSSARPSSST
jgi:3-isopropylmalate dehydrogenase